jgi:hypothetical protein
MRLEDVTAEIRPRSDWEAVDLGFALARREFWRCFSVWWLTVLVPSIVAAILLWDSPFWFAFLFWWWRPAASRMVLFLLSRRLFGAQPGWKQIFPQIPRAWWRRFFYRFIWARCSPWAPLTMAVEDLEGLRGGAYSQRSKLLLRRGEGAVGWLSAVGSMMAGWLAICFLLLAWMLMPEGQAGIFDQTVDALQSGEFLAIPLGALWLTVGCYAVAISLCDVFVTAGGFGIYVNNRTWIEGWDVELAFKRLANRITKVAAVLVAAFVMVISSTPVMAAGGSPSEVIREVKAHPDFNVEMRKIPIEAPSAKTPPKSRTSSSRSSYSSSGSSGGGSSGLEGVFGSLGVLALVILAAALIAGVVWMLWRHRSVRAPSPGSSRSSRPTARVVMGMEVSRDTLPEDIPTMARRLWGEGRRHEAIALLYRGAISRAMETGRVEIMESDTEGDCLRRVREAGAPAHPGYFQRLTGYWIALAYAHSFPLDAEVHDLCSQWPYVERRRA